MTKIRLNCKYNIIYTVVIYIIIRLKSIWNIHLAISEAWNENIKKSSAILSYYVQLLINNFYKKAVVIIAIIVKANLILMIFFDRL